jgi:CDP-glucose 4,6-dehydratase
MAVSVDKSQKPQKVFWHNKKVLVTGHTGFKGSWLAFWLHRMGAKVTGISLPPSTSPNLFQALNLESSIDNHYCDIRDADALKKIVIDDKPDIVLHLAAQALVRESYQAPLDTFSTNVMGTANLLDSLRDTESVKVAVLVTTDKVYKNKEWSYPYRENDELGGHAPYSASKAAAELVISSYRDAFLAEQQVAIASARAGNVIGGGDWSDDRLIPDAVRAWESNQPLDIRSPNSTRPWQHVLEPLAGYLVLAEKLWHKPKLAGAFNFGPPANESSSVKQVIELARTPYPKAQVNYGTVNSGPHEASALALEIAKTHQLLSFQSTWNLAQSVNRSLNWYHQFNLGEDATKLCEQDINAYESI